MSFFLGLIIGGFSKNARCGPAAAYGETVMGGSGLAAAIGGLVCAWNKLWQTSSKVVLAAWMLLEAMNGRLRLRLVRRLYDGQASIRYGPAWIVGFG